MNKVKCFSKPPTESLFANDYVEKLDKFIQDKVVDRIEELQSMIVVYYKEKD